MAKPNKVNRPKPTKPKKPNKGNKPKPKPNKTPSFAEMTKNDPYLEQSKKNETAKLESLKKDYETAIKNDPYMNMYNQQSGLLNSQAAQQKEYQQGILNQNTGSINAGYDRGANDAYINYKQAQVALPEQLSNLGATGGASESSNIKLQSAYASNLQKNENARNASLTEARNAYAANVNDIDSNLNAALADAYQYYGGLSTDYKQDALARYEADKKAAQVDGWNQRVQSNINKRKGQGWEVIQWQDSDGKLHYLQDKGATYLAKQAKKTAAAVEKANQLTRKQGQALADRGYSVKYIKDNNTGLLTPLVSSKKKIVSGSSGGGGGRRGSSGGHRYSGGGSSGGGGGHSYLPPVVSNSKGGGGSKGNKKVYNNLMNMIGKNMMNPGLSGSRLDKKIAFLAKQVNNAYRSGKISSKQFNKLMNTIQRV